MMSLRTQRALQSLILAGLGVFLLQRLWTGTLYWYINSRFFALALGAAIGFLILARVVVPGQPAPNAPPAAPEHAVSERGDHRPGQSLGAPAWQFWMLALPLVLGLLVPPRPLGAAALANRGLNVSLPPAVRAANPAPTALPSTQRTVLDWVRTFGDVGNPAELAGQEADVIGFVFHDSRLAQGEFIVGRFTLTCCAADATGVGMLVQWPRASALDSDAWVRVRGPVQAGNYAGRPIPVISAVSVEGITPPQFPYIYP